MDMKFENMFFRRQEDAQKIEITFFGVPIIYYSLLVVLLIGIFSRGALTNIVLLAYLVGLIVYLYLIWQPLKEIYHVMSTTGVMAKGSKLSFKNPITITIQKTSTP